MASDQNTSASPTVTDSAIGLLSLSNEILTQIIANFGPSSDDATTAVCLALTSRRLYGILSTIIGGNKLNSLCPKPKYWWFLDDDYKLDVQARLLRHWKEATRARWSKAVPYLRLVSKLRDGSMDVMERQGYVFESGKAVWIKPEKLAVDHGAMGRTEEMFRVFDNRSGSGDWAARNGESQLPC